MFYTLTVFYVKTFLDSQEVISIWNISSYYYYYFCFRTHLPAGSSSYYTHFLPCQTG